MQFCKDCNVKMIEVMSFSKYKKEKFERCPKCYSETKHRKLDDKELYYGEVIYKEVYKRK